jgi:predicted ATPase/signal transduction histidine kinase
VVPADYTADRLLRQTPATSVYQARRKRDGARVVLKLANGEFPTAVALARLRHEHAILTWLSELPSVVRAPALEKCGNGLALVLEDAGERSVKTLIESGSLGLKQRIELALRMTSAVEALHQRHVIHKDLQPDHFLIDEDGALRLIDFGTATRLSLETPAISDAFEGTLAYMSPEQTGRMNRFVDRRSDLYSLGVSLYELFTGARPFVSDDPLELVHSHIAKTPRPPHEVRPEVPKVLSAIVMKLLSKAAEARYQDAGGLRADLETCLSALTEQSDVADFDLGRADASRELRIPQKLYGRSEQLAALHASFERARAGGVELLLVKGGSGTGKSALVHELNKALVREGVVVSGKFDQLSRNVPYAPIVHGCRQLVRRVLAQPPEKLDSWRDRISRALGSNGRLVVELVPELETVIGAQPPVPDLGPSESQHRFETTFLNFLEVFASDGHTLVFFLDDLQWADAASLRLVQLMMTSPNAGHALLIGAYRDNEVDSHHALALALAGLAKTSAKIQEIELCPLDRSHVTELLAETLRATPAAVGELASLTHKKTLGNPFFVGQFLKALHTDGLVGFDADAHAWKWDAGGIDKKMVTDNVVDFMLAKLGELPAASRRLLELAACIGHEFDRETLCIISERAPADVVSSLWDALSVGLVLPLDANYRYDAAPDAIDGASLNARYRFLHDRVQQTAYSLIDRTNREAVHLRIARLLLAARGGDPNPDELFLVVDHLNIGAPQITDPAERKLLGELNLRAGVRARDAAAYGAASRLLESCVAALGDDPWTADYETAYRAYLTKAECEFLSARTDDSFRSLAEVEKRARTALERAAAGALKTIMLTTLNRLGDAVACGADTIRDLGIDIPREKDALGPAVGAELGGVVKALEGRNLDDIVELPLLRDPTQLAFVDLVFRLVPSTFQSDQTLLALLLSKAVGLMLKDGNAPSAPHLYVTFSLIYGGATRDVKTAFGIGRAAIALNDRLQGRSGAASATHFVYGVFVAHWWRPLAESLDHIERAMKAGLETGDLPHFGYAATYGIIYRYYGGECLEELEPRSLSVLALHKRNEDALNLVTVTVYRQAFAALRGEAVAPGTLATADLDEEELLRRLGPNQSGVSMFHLLRAHVSYFAGKYRAAFDAATASEALQEYTRGMLADVDRIFFRAISAGQLLRAAQGEERDKLIEALEKDIAVLGALPEGSLHNGGHRRTLAQAELAAATGAFDTALGLYESAIGAARENGFVHHQAIANELCGLFHLQRGRQALARAHLLEAQQGLLHWGAKAAAESLAARHPTVMAQGSVTRGTLDQMLDVASVMKAAAAISREVEIQPLLRKLVKTCLESGGAETVALVLKEGEELVVVGQSRVGEEAVVVPSSIDRCGVVSPTIVRFVLRSGKPTVVDDAMTDPTFGGADDIQRRKPRSIIAVPLLRGGAAMGVLYLENNRMAAAFNPERVRVLELLAVQAAISVDNARLYGVLTDKNAALEQALEVTQEAARLKNEFVANTSHELRTPLNAIINIPIGITERLTDREAWRCAECESTVLAPETAPVEPPGRCPFCSASAMEKAAVCTFNGTHEKALKYLDVVRVNGEQLLHVINDLLDMSKLDAGKLKVRLEPLVLSEVARDVIDGMQGLAEQHRLTFRHAGGDESATIQGDHLRLRQVVTNLVANALKFSDPGTEVTVEVERTADVTLLRVRDQGVGIAPADHEKVFESFYQVEGSNTRRAKGTGLGLAISRRIVELHGGSIRVESALGEGATFIVRLPHRGGPGEGS